MTKWAETLDPRGTHWMGTTPSGWRVHPVKRHFDVQLGKMLQNAPLGEQDRSVRYLKAFHVSWGRVATDDLPEMWASADDLRQYSVRAGDLLVCEGGEVGRAGIIGTVPPNSIIQNSLHRVRAKDSSDVRYLQHVLCAVGAAGWFEVLCNRATIAHLTSEKLAELRIPLPAVEEQRAIAARLDRETARIDALIDKKHRQIELLQEQRLAVIHHSITQGLNAGAPLKATPIPWAPKIPRHWQSLRLRRLGKIDQGCAFQEALQGSSTGELAWYKVNDMTRDGNDIVMSEADNYVSSDVAKNVGATIFPAGTIVFPRVGAALLTNKRRILGRPAIIDDNTYGFIPRGLDSRFAYFALLMLDMSSICSPGLVPTVTIPAVKDVQVPVPPLKEQIAIANHVERMTQQADRLIAKLRLSVSMLREFRAALVSAAVTGRLKLREEVAA